MQGDRFLKIILLSLCVLFSNCYIEKLIPVRPDGYISERMFNLYVERLYKEIDELKSKLREKKMKTQQIKRKLEAELKSLEGRVIELEERVRSLTNDFNNKQQEGMTLEEEEKEELEYKSKGIEDALKKLDSIIESNDENNSYENVTAWWDELPNSWKKHFTKYYSYADGQFYNHSNKKLEFAEKEKIYRSKSFQFNGEKEKDSEKLTDLIGPSTIPNLKEIDVPNNQLESNDLNVILRKPSIEKIRLGNNKLKTLESFRKYNLKRLVSLYIENNEISSLSFVEKCSGLKTLVCRNNQIASLNGIQSLLRLEFLYAGNNPIRDFSAIIELIKNSNSKIKHVQIPIPNDKAIMKKLEDLPRVKSEEVELVMIPSNL